MLLASRAAARTQRVGVVVETCVCLVELLFAICALGFVCGALVGPRFLVLPALLLIVYVFAPFVPAAMCV